MGLMAAALMSFGSMVAIGQVTPLERWLSCSSVEAPSGVIYVDNIAFAIFDPNSAVVSEQAAAMLDAFVQRYGAPRNCRAMVEARVYGPRATRRDLRLAHRRARAVAAHLRRNALRAPIEIVVTVEAQSTSEVAEGDAALYARSVVVWVGGELAPGQRDTNAGPRRD